MTNKRVVGFPLLRHFCCFSRLAGHVFPVDWCSYCSLDSFAAHGGIRKSKGTLRWNAWTLPSDLGKGCGIQASFACMEGLSESI